VVIVSTIYLKMLSRSGLRSLSYLIQVVTNLGLVPFKWNIKTFSIERDRKWRFYTWITFVLIEILHSIFLFWRLYQSIFVVRIPRKLVAAQALWNTLFLLPLVLHFTTFQHLDRIPKFLNRWLQMECRSNGKSELNSNAV